jgi:RHS repeat-associated protein
VDYKARYKASEQAINDTYAAVEVPYYGTDNDDYVNGQSFCCDNKVLKSFDPGKKDNPELYQYSYHSDHLGSSSLFTNLDGEIVQHVEYVPFGEVFIEERNNTWNTPYLFNAKELDEETGLYYYGARYYDARISLWLSADPLQEKYPNVSTYAYCVQNPVKFVDPTGMDWVLRLANNKYEVFYDRHVRSQRDVYDIYGSDSKMKHIKNGISVTFKNSNGEKTASFTFFNDEKENKYGTVWNEQGEYLSRTDITEGSNYRIFGVSDESVDAATLYQNFFGSTYIGPNNPKTYEDKEGNRTDSYQANPIGEADKSAYQHDLNYDELNAKGLIGALFNRKTAQADRDLADRCKAIMNNPNLPEWDRNRAIAIYGVFNVIAKTKGK